MKKPLIFDALNTLTEEIVEINGGNGKLKIPAQRLTDIVLDFLIMSYMYGADYLSEMIGENVTISYETLNAVIYHRYEDGKTFEDRIAEYAPSSDGNKVISKKLAKSSKETIKETEKASIDAQSEKYISKTSGKSGKQSINDEEDDDVGSVSDIIRIADTESLRVFNQSIVDSADKSGKKYTKTWVTMKDDKVRDTHWYLEGSTVNKGERFYTFDNDSASFPGDFVLPQNNCNCRCTLLIKPV